MHGAEVIVTGSINADLVFSVPHLPAPGETVGEAKFALHPGGKGANQAVAAARMGAAAAMLGCIGDDQYGAWLVSAMQREGVDCQGIETVPGPTGCAGVLVDNGGNNCIAVAGGANSHFTPAIIHKFRDLIAHARVLMAQLEVPLQTVAAALETARAAGVITILDPAPAQRLEAEFLKLVDYITPNSQEASVLTGVDVHCWSTAAEAARKLRRLGARNVLVTMGQLGAFYSAQGGEVRIAAPRVQAVDSTAAGDAFNGALAAALVRGVRPDQAADFAAAAGAWAASRPGAQPSLPGLEDIAKVVALPW